MRACGPVLSVAGGSLIGMEARSVPVIDALAALETALADAQKVFAEGLWQVPETDLPAVLERVHALDARLSSLVLGVVREVDTRSIPATVGAKTVKTYLSARLRITPRLAKEYARLSEAFAARNTATGAALAEARISREQATAISDTLDGLPDKATADQRAWAQAFLLDKAGLFDARDLRRLGKYIDDAIDPDGKPDREDTARKKRALHVIDNHDGTQTLRWTDTDENMAFAKTALEALAKPVPGEDGEHDPRPDPLRKADAMVDIIHRTLNSGELSLIHGIRPHLHVTFTAEAMRGEAGAPPPRTATGDHLSPAVLQRLLCDASLTGILLDGEGVPLKLGRTVRTATPGQRIALIARDGGCAFPACTRPANWCQAHHFPEWTENGATDTDKMGLFCLVHHHFLHEGGWKAQLGPDGHVEVIPPTWIDIQQRPRRNWHWQHQRDLFDAEAGTDRGP